MLWTKSSYKQDRATLERYFEVIINLKMFYLCKLFWNIKILEYVLATLIVIPSVLKLNLVINLDFVNNV